MANSLSLSFRLRSSLTRFPSLSYMFRAAHHLESQHSPVPSPKAEARVYWVEADTHQGTEQLTLQPRTRLRSTGYDTLWYTKPVVRTTIPDAYGNR